MAEQAARETHASPVSSGWIRRQQVAHDRVVVARVERDIGSTAVGHGAGDIQSAVAIEGRDFDRDDALDAEKRAPESSVEHPPAYGGLKVEADDRNDLGNQTAVLEQGLVGRVT